MGRWEHEGNQTQVEAWQWVGSEMTVKIPTLPQNAREGWGTRMKLHIELAGNFCGLTVV